VTCDLYEKIKMVEESIQKGIRTTCDGDEMIKRRIVLYT
jgi:hypothetical protein